MLLSAQQFSNLRNKITPILVKKAMMRHYLLILLLLTIAICAHAQSSQWSYGAQAGVSAYTTTGSLKDNFKGAVGFTGGITADYQRLRLKADVTYSQPSFKNRNMYGVLDSQGRDAQLNAVANASHVATSVQVGYRVALLGQLSITPSAGIYYSHYSWKVNDIKWDKNEQDQEYFQITDTHPTTQGRVSWIASIDFDVRLHDTYTDILGPQQRLRSSLRITPWVTSIKHSTVVPSVSGLQMGINVTYSGLLSSIGQ